MRRSWVVTAAILVSVQAVAACGTQQAQPDDDPSDGATTPVQVDFAPARQAARKELRIVDPYLEEIVPQRIRKALTTASTPEYAMESLRIEAVGVAKYDVLVQITHESGATDCVTYHLSRRAPTSSPAECP